MKRITSTIFTLLFLSSQIFSQSTAFEVYELMSTKCASAGCHNSADAAAGLDLQGEGSSISAQAQDVFNNVFNVTPANSYAAGKGYKQIYPGRVDKSFLFRTINEDFEPTIELDEAEGGHATTNLLPEEKELIRQWINYGAKATGELLDTDLISDYYNVNGLPSYPDGPPPAPAAEEGFQIKMGPFLIEPSGELEYFQKWELDLPEDVEVNRIELMMSNYSHHFIIYDFNPGGANFIPAGLRLEPDHSQIGLVAAVQEPTDLKLPEGTAFKWEEGLVLDLNTHYINYSANSTYLAEAYLNIYTQPTGTAKQEMKTELFANFNIPIPNNENTIPHEEPLNYFLGDIYLWGLMGHTHKYGTGYEVYKRNIGQEGEMIYDASCPQGIPGCVSPYFDYQHIPFRYFNDGFLPVTMNFSNGLIHKATWLNDGPFPVNFGSTSDDEMMVLVMMYLDDITGLTVSNNEVDEQLQNVLLAPNPMQDEMMVSYPMELEGVTFSIYDMVGRKIIELSGTEVGQIKVDRTNLTSGMYVYRLEDENGRYKAGKFVVE